MKVKSNIIALLGFLVMFVNTSCNDLLTETPDSYYATENFFTKPENANMAVLGIYDVFAKLSHYGMYEMAMPTSDDMYTITGTTSDNTRRDISHYLVAPQNIWLKDRSRLLSGCPPRQCCSARWVRRSSDW